MAQIVTLASLRTQAQQRADMVNSQFLATDEWNTNINASARELYDLLITVFQEYFQSTSVVTTDGINDTYSLPGDFYKLLGADEVINPTTGEAVTLSPYMLAERNRYGKLTGAGRIVNLIYAPTMPALVNDTDTFDGVNGWEEYIVVDAAIKALVKEESDTSTHERAKAALIDRINACAPNRDAGAVDRVVDIYAYDPLVMPIESKLRYHLQAGSIKFVESFRR